MTLEEAMALEAGQAIDALVAERVMGWHRGKMGVNAGFWVDGDEKEMAVCIDFYSAGWSPSRNVAHVWDVRNVVKNWLFSQRRDFMAFLQLIVSKRLGTKEVLAQEGLLLLIEPIDVCRAALLAAPERRA